MPSSTEARIVSFMINHCIPRGWNSVWHTQLTFRIFAKWYEAMTFCCCCLFVLFFNCVINPLEYKHQEGRGCLLHCYIPPARKHRAWQKSALDQCLLKSMDNCLLEWMYENNSSASATVWCVWLRCHVPQGVHTLEALHTTAWQIWFFRNKKYIYILQVQSRSIIIMREK